MLLDLAQADRRALRHLTARMDRAATTDELAAATRQAITAATSFDQRDSNHNFAYDSEASGEVKRNLGRLIAGGQLRQALALALELRKHGSHQVEMSDEGLKTEESEDCLSVVVQELQQGKLPADEVHTWCAAMLANDRVGFIAQEALESLRKQSQPPAAR
jgi:hypothetical protein